jgi:hypothetical protein
MRASGQKHLSSQRWETKSGLRQIDGSASTQTVWISRQEVRTVTAGI